MGFIPPLTQQYAYKCLGFFPGQQQMLMFLRQMIARFLETQLMDISPPGTSKKHQHEEL